MLVHRDFRVRLTRDASSLQRPSHSASSSCRVFVAPMTSGHYSHQQEVLQRQAERHETEELEKKLADIYARVEGGEDAADLTAPRGALPMASSSTPPGLGERVMAVIVTVGIHTLVLENVVQRSTLSASDATAPQKCVVLSSAGKSSARSSLRATPHR